MPHHSKMENIEKREKWLVVLSFLTIYVVWGSTYLFVAFAVRQLPPFYMSATRYLLATLILILLGLISQKIQIPKKREFINSFIIGVLFLGIGVPGVAWALKTLDTGFAALLISTEPLIVVLLLWLIDRRRPLALSFVGITLGMVGVGLLVSQRQLLVDARDWYGVLVIMIAIVGWAFGAIYVGRAEIPKSGYMNNAIQIFAGFIVTFFLTSVFEPVAPSIYQWQGLTWLSMAFLVLLGSVLAFSAFNYLLARVSPEKVATGTYVNPVVALLLGWLFNNETVSVQSIVAALIMLLGVYFINSAKSKRALSRRKA